MPPTRLPGVSTALVASLPLRAMANVAGGTMSWIPVVDENNRPVGVLSLNDLALESVEPDTRMKDGVSRVAHMLAAVCRPRVAKRVAA